MVFCIHIGLRAEDWSANFCLFRGEWGGSSETNIESGKVGLGTTVEYTERKFKTKAQGIWMSR